MKEQVLDATKIVLVTFLFTAAIIPVIKKIAIHVGAIDVPRADEGHRHIHKKATPMLGGVGIFGISKVNWSFSRGLHYCLLWTNNVR